MAYSTDTTSRKRRRVVVTRPLLAPDLSGPPLDHARGLTTLAEAKARAALGWVQIILTRLHAGKPIDTGARLLLSDSAIALRREGEALIRLAERVREIASVSNPSNR